MNIPKRVWGGFCLLIAVPTGFFGILFVFCCVWAIIQINKGQDFGDGLGLGIAFAGGLLTVAVVFGISGWELLKTASSERSKKKAS